MLIERLLPGTIIVQPIDIAAAIVAQAPPRFALAGLSMGGYIALEICRKYGDRVDRLALVETSARPAACSSHRGTL